MKTIVPNQEFKHGRETYEKGKSYEVSDEEAYYFTANGWVGPEPETGKEHTLDIHDVTSGHEAEVI